MENHRKYVIDNKTIGQIGGRLLGEFLERESRKFMQRFADKTRVSDMHERSFVEGFAGQRMKDIAAELEELWPHLTTDQALDFLARFAALVNPPEEG